jgi:DNA polymerase-3 subunit gamma/tau
MEDQTNKFAVKYRPVMLNDFYGNREVIKEVKTFLKNGTTPSCILITGETGSGKTTLARIIARYVNRVKEVSAINDIIELDIGSSGTVEATNAWIQQTQFLPRNPNHKRVFILDEAHVFTKASASGLLKMLEEPKPHNIFILCTNEPQQLLPTLRSRCIQLNLKAYDTDDIASMLKSVCDKEGLPITQDALYSICAANSNQPRAALNILQKVSYSYKEGKEINIDKALETSSPATVESNKFLTAIYERNLVDFMDIVLKMDCTAVINLALACNRELISLAYSKEFNVMLNHNVIYPYLVIFENLPKFTYRFSLYVHKVLTKIKTTNMLVLCPRDVIISEFYELFSKQEAK